MGKSVKIRDEDKERLDRIKAKLTLMGIKINQEQLLGKIISITESSSLLLEEIEFYPLSKDRKAAVLSKTYSLGTTTEETIDDDLYSGK